MIKLYVKNLIQIRSIIILKIVIFLRGRDAKRFKELGF